ncbi:hypothetical protein T4A_3035 [Trichinella pseudospiralis]|uniref:Uncharacterized protein n=1 Tax=Trichinella pseudospiralis TaxID=6337 RepID=A0A0V1DYV1_TRIPS|nr:hypothetical protein T4A_3035 [Trichinella pseudospiralis]
MSTNYDNMKIRIHLAHRFHFFVHLSGQIFLTVEYNYHAHLKTTHVASSLMSWYSLPASSGAGKRSIQRILTSLRILGDLSRKEDS